MERIVRIAHFISTVKHGSSFLLMSPIVCATNDQLLFLSVQFSLELYNETIRWEDDTQPRSICSERCPIGHVQNHQDQCCWSCVKCREEFEYVDNDTCISCPPGNAPNERRTGCNKLKAIIIDWWSPWAYVPLIFASAGILATIFTTAIFIK